LENKFQSEKLSTDFFSDVIHPNDEMMQFIKNKKFPESHYFENGKKHCQMFFREIKRLQPSLLSDKRILDYGCGHGRITRHLKSMLKPSKLVVADIWDSAVNFCANEFNARPFHISDTNKISSVDEKFDIIISYSVFSHLPPHLFEFTLYELQKILDRGGLLLFTTKGDYHVKKLQISLKEGYHYGSIWKVPNHTKGRISAENYSLMIVTRPFVENLLKKVGLELLAHLQEPERLSSQEMYVVRKKL